MSEAAAARSSSEPPQPTTPDTPLPGARRRRWLTMQGVAHFSPKLLDNKDTHNQLTLGER